MIEVATALIGTIKKVTKKHTQQVKREERNLHARFRRQQSYEPRKSKKSIVFGVLPEAYAKASDHGRLPAHQRQIYYAARALWLEKDADMDLSYNAFCQYLAEYQAGYCPRMRVIKDARGKLVEPHTRRSVPLGTLEVDRYLKGSGSHSTKSLLALSDEVQLSLRHPTSGPDARFSAMIYLEKEGFNVILEEAGIPQRYDVAVASSKGQSVVAMRRLVDVFCGRQGIPLLIVHDFDKAGFSIADSLVRDSLRYQFEHDIQSVDLGLRLTDIEKYGLASEPCVWKGTPPPNATQQEAAFLMSGRRVELNAFTSPQFVAWIEQHLQANQIRKVIPIAETLEAAYRRLWLRTQLQSQINDLKDDLVDEAEALEVPRELTEFVAQELTESPHLAWDDVLARIVKARPSS